MYLILPWLHSGSSPHTRGTHRVGKSADDLARLIPAHAGNSHDQYHPGPASPAHPRTRGELLVNTSYGFLMVGSSPHTRGTPDDLSVAAFRWRLIPAHAGNSAELARHVRPHTAHPRTRGELSSAPKTPESLAGSSPHTRGTQDGFEMCRAQLRLIPAHAGNSCRRHHGGKMGPAHPRTRGELKAP